MSWTHQLAEAPGHIRAFLINTNRNPFGWGGKPVSFYNGAEEMALTDLVVNGVFPIVIQRKYDSRSNYDSPLGYGWAFMHDRRLYEYPDNSVVVRHGCGTRDRYVYSGSAYVTPVGSMLATLSEQPDGSFQLRYINGVTDYFDSQGRMGAEVAPQNETVFAAPLSGALRVKLPPRAAAIRSTWYQAFVRQGRCPVAVNIVVASVPQAALRKV